MTGSYCYIISEADSRGVVRHGAGRQHPCVRCHGNFENMEMGRGSSSRVVAETKETRRTVTGLQEKTRKLAERGRSTESGGRLWMIWDLCCQSRYRQSGRRFWKRCAEVVKSWWKTYNRCSRFEPFHDLHLGI